MKNIKIIRYGCTRITILWKDYAIKIPCLDEWRLFLNGLLANMQECRIFKAGCPEVCPVLWSLPGGWMLIMKRAREMTDDEFMKFDSEKWADREDYIIPVEHKSMSFGWIDGKIVAIDYGN